MPKLRKQTNADISAVFADTVAIRTYRNQNIVTKVTVPRKSKSAKLQASKDRFAEANNWATAILQDPEMLKLYSKGINDRLSSAHTVASTDYLVAPTIHYISLKQHTGAVGDKIRIKATDNFQVIAVDVTITDKNGKELERGSAIRNKRKPTMWIYTLTVANPDVVGTVIEVTAMDRPRNTVVKKETVV